MKVKISANEQVSSEAQVYLDKVSDVLSEKFEDINAMEPLERMYFQGSAVVYIPDKGKAKYVKLKDYLHSRGVEVRCN